MRFKKITAGLLAAAMTVTSLATNLSVSAEQVTAQAVEDDSVVSRAEWLSDLTKTFGFTVEDDEYPDNYFADLSQDNEYYYDVLVAVEYGLVNIESGENVYPNEPTTRQFAAQTLNFCLGYQIIDSEYTFNESTDPNYVDSYDDFQAAINRGWFTTVDGNFLPEKNITADEAEKMLADAAEILKSEDIKDTGESEYEFADYVIQFSKDTTASIDENRTVTVVDPDKSVKVGDTFVVFIDGKPLIYKAVTVTESGSNLVITTDMAPADSIINANISTAQSLSVDDVEFSPIGNTQVTYIKTMEQARAVAKPMGLTPIKDSIVYSDTVSLGSGVSVTIYGSLYNLTEYDEEHISGLGFKKSGTAYVTGSFELRASLTANLVETFKGKNSVQLGTLRAGAVFGDLFLDLDLSGNLITEYSGTFKLGASVDENGRVRAIKQFTKKSFSACGEVNAQIGLTAKLGLNVLIAGIDIYASAGLQANLKAENFNDGKTPKTCATMRAFVYARAGLEGWILWKKLDLPSYDIWTSSNSPCRLYVHFEDGRQVSSCARDRSQYVSPSSTRYGGPYSSSGSSLWAEGYNPGASIEPTPKVLWEYQLDSDENATITKYNGYSSTVVIPSELDGYKVTCVGSNAFYNNKRLVMVVIPDSVTSIGNYAFNGCTSLSSVTLSKKLQRVGYRAFDGCENLKSIEIPKSLEYVNYNYSDYAYYEHSGIFYNSGIKNVTFEKGTTKIIAGLFYDSDSLEKITIPDTVTEICEDAFFGCDNLASVTIPDSVIKIDDNAFDGCKSLDNVIIPDSVTEIADEAFGGCALTSINIPDSVTSIGNFAFSGCSSLSNVTLSKSLTYLGTAAFNGCTKLTSIQIPKSLETIGRSIYSTGGAFTNSGLKNVTFEKGTTKIIADLFYDCDSLEKITIPDTVTEVGDSAFQYCDNLSSVTIPSSVKIIDTDAFCACVSLDNIVIPNGVTEIRSSAFGGCMSLTSIDIHDSVVIIGSSAFGGCTSLPSIVIPNSVTSIGNYAFNGCTSLSSVTLSKGLTSLGYEVFVGCKNLTSIEIPKSLESVGYYTVYYDGIFTDSGLKNVTFEKGTTKIVTGLFYDCDSLEKITIPDTVTEICDYAFRESDNLVSVTIPDSVTKIGDMAFFMCTSLDNVNIPDSMTEIGESAFSGCTSLEKAVVPGTVSYIKDSTFSGCTSLTSLTMNKGITQLGKYSFSGCKKLVSVTMPDTVTYMGEHAFDGCASLESITLSKSLERIYNNSFTDCSSLKSITIPEGVTDIGTEAFSKCTALSEVKLPSTLKNINYLAFNDCDSLTKIVIPEGTEIIDSSAFYDCDALTTVVLPDSLKSVGSSAFYGCETLTDVDFGNGASVISSDAFRLCPALKKVVLPKNLTEIGTGAFAENTKLTDVTIYPNTVTIPDDAFSYPTRMTIYGYKGSYAEEYANKRNIKFSALSKIPADKLKVEIEPQDYTGEQITPDFLIIDDGYKLIEGTDMEVTSYGENIELGKGTVSVKLIGLMYDGNIDISFDIIRTDLHHASCSRSGSVYYNYRYLTQDEDYTISYRYDTDSEDVDVILTGINNFTGTVVFYGDHEAVFEAETADEPKTFTYLDEKWEVDFSEENSDFWSKVDSIEAVVGYTGNSAQSKLSCIDADGKLHYTSIYGSSTAVIENIGGLLSGTDSSGKEKGMVSFEWTELSSNTKAKLISVTLYDKNGNILKEYNNIHNWLDCGYIEDDEGYCYFAVLGGNVNDSLTIPEYVDGKYIEKIGENAFKGNTSVKLVNIPITVNEIGQNAFAKCTSITDVYYDGSASDWKEITIAGGNEPLLNANIHFAVIEEHIHTPQAAVKEDIVDPTCVKNGSYDNVVYCSECGEEISRETVTVPATGKHTYGEWETTKTPTCATGGTRTRTCSVCKKTETQTIDPTGDHTPAEAVKENEVKATCGKDGSYDKVVYCSVCKAEMSRKTEAIPATGKHTFGEWKTTKAATCAAAGTQTRTCSVCGKTETQTIAATGKHTASAAVKENVKNATCAKAGSYDEVVYCSVCKAQISRKTVTVSATGKHTASSAVKENVKDATCITDGSYDEVVYCSVCKAQISRTPVTVPATGKHTYVDKVVAPTYTTEGYTEHTCSVCGNSYKDSFVPKLVKTPAKVKSFGLKARGADAIQLKWAKSADADGYVVEQQSGNTWKTVKEINSAATTNCRISGLKGSTKYTWRIKAYKNSNGEKLYGEAVTASYTTNPTVVAGFKLTKRADNALTFSWSKNATANGYIIEKKVGGEWIRVKKITNPETTSYTVTGLKSSTAYDIRIKSYYMAGKTALYSKTKTVSARTNPSVITGLKLKARVADALRLTWTKNTSADGYIIEMKNGNSWTRVGKITSNSTVEFKKSGLKAGTAYTFRVKAYKMSGKTALYGTAKTISVRTNPSTVSGLKLKASAKDAIRLAWSKNTSADGYIIEMKSGSTWTRVGKVTKNSTVEFRKEGLKSKTSYTFRIKAYKMDGKTALYGATKTITVKTK